MDYGPNVSTEFGFKADGQSINAFGSGDGRRGLGMDSEDVQNSLLKRITNLDCLDLLQVPQK